MRRQRDLPGTHQRDMDESKSRIVNNPFLLKKEHGLVEVTKFQ